MNSDYLKKNIVDIREELRKANLQSVGYLSLRELYGDDEDENEKNDSNKKQKYFSAFRILGKTKKVQKCGQFIIPDCDFDVEHDLNPSVEVISELSKSQPSKFHIMHKEIEEAYQRMHDQIHTKMPQIPMFAPWFELLKIVSFGAHYVQTLIESGIQPCIPEPILVKPFPAAMPPIPIRRMKTFHINLSFYDFIQQLSPQTIKIIDDHMYKLINDELFDFKSIENVLIEESRKIIKKKLTIFLPTQQIEHRDDSELQIQIINFRIQAQLQEILSVQSHKLMNIIFSYKEFLNEQLLHDLNELSFKQQLVLIRQKLPLIIKGEMYKGLEKFDKDVKTLTDQRDEIQRKINNRYSELSRSKYQVINDLKSNVTREQKKALDWKNEQLNSVNLKISGVPYNQVNWIAVNEFKQEIENKYSSAMNSLAENERKAINLVNNDENDKKKLIQNDEKNVDMQYQKEKSEINKKRNEFQIAFNKELDNIEKQFNEFEKNKQNELTAFIKLLDENEKLNDQMKKCILLEKIRLSFIDVASDSTWSQNIKGGCSVKASIEPEVIQVPSISFNFPFSENRNFETVVQNYLISGILIEHKWYASPQSFVDNSLELKNNSDTKSIDNLGGKRIIDFVIETGNIDFLRILKPENIDNPGIDGFSPLLTAVILSNYEMVKVLLQEFKANFNFKHPNGLTPLIAATQSGNTEIALLLLEQPGIIIDDSLDTGMSPMHFAILNSDTAVIQKLTSLGLYADSVKSIRNQDGCNPFLYAAKLGFADGLNIMRVNDKDCCSADGSNALHWAAGNNTNSLKCIELLYNKFKISPEKLNCRKQYPLHVAIESRNDDSAIFLYDICTRCASIKDDRNKTPKELAIMYGAVGFLAHAFPKQSIINNMIQNGNRHIEDAIQDAILRMNIPDTSRLIGELSNQKNISKILEKLIKTTLIVGSEQLLDIVIRATSDIRIIKFSHEMVLPHLVVQSGQYKLIPSVSKLGFKFDEKDDLGNTPIWYAVTADDSKTMKMILKSRENTENLIDLFKNASQKAFEDRKSNCIKSLIKFQKKSKNQIKISGTYLCNNLNVTANDVNKAIQIGLEIKKSDILMAAAKSTPDVLTLIIQHFCKENNSFKKDIISECLKVSCKEVRLDNILALYKLSDGKMENYFDSVKKQIKTTNAQYSFWIIEALNGDQKNLIQKKVQEIGNLLKNGIDISFSKGSGIRKKMSSVFQDFPLRNMKIEFEMPFLHYAIRFNAIWAFSCLQKNYDISHKINGCTAYDFLPFASKNLLDFFWTSPDINQVLESLTMNFSEICVYLGCGNEFVANLCKTVNKKSKYLKSKVLLHILIRSKASINDLEPIIKSRQDWCQCVDENGCTPLMHAISIQNYELARLIIKNIPSQDIEFRNYSGNNVLHLLILSSDSENRDLSDFAMELISKCPQLLRMKNREGQTPYSLAAFKGQITLLAAFGSFDYFDPEVVIHSAAAGNQVNIIKFIFNSDCSSIRVDSNARLQHVTNKIQNLGDNFLHTAARFGSVEAFKELVKIGTNPMQVNSINMMPIEIALQSGNTKMIEFIIGLPSLLNASSSIKGRAITSCAIGSKKYIKGLDTMIKCGFPIASMHLVGYPLIHCAALADNADAIHLVLNSGADILAVSTSKMTVLHLCSMKNKPNALRICLDWASFCLSHDEFYKWIEAKDEEECTALHLAAKGNNDSCVSILLAYGANPNAFNSKKLTPAQLAVVSNSLNSLGALLQIAKDNSYNGSYPLEYVDITNQFKKKFNDNEISIPQKIDTKTALLLSNFPNQVKKRLMPLNSNVFNISENENDSDEDNDDDLIINETIPQDFYKTFGDKFGQKSVEVLEKFSLYPLSQIQLIKTIENDLSIIDEFVSILKNIKIDIIASIIPNIPFSHMIPFLNTIKETIKIADKCPVIWEWFKAYFSLSCNPTTVEDEINIPSKDDFTASFDYFLMILNRYTCFNDLSWPKLPRLSVFNGENCSMLAVKEALSKCTDKVLQIKNINEIPLNNKKIEKFLSLAYPPKYFGNYLLWCRNGSIILDVTKNIQKDGSFMSFNLVNNLDAFALLTIRAMFSGVTISNFTTDFRKEKEDTKNMINKVALQLNPSDFIRVREWCAAALFCSKQCGPSILNQLCDLVSSKKCSISDILYICNIISRMKDTSKIESALRSSNPKENITQLMSKENNSKSFDTLIKEMSTSIKGEFQPYKFPFDGTPVYCLQKNDISALYLVYNAMITIKPPSTMMEIQEEVSRLGKEMKTNPNERSLGHLLAILSHSFEVIFKIRPYLIQCMTVAGLILSEIHQINGLKGRIAQVATGEGKSIDIVLLASICAAQERCVDIITSTHYLAQRDYHKYAPFYEFIGLSSGCIAKQPKPLPEDFNGIILYGINTDFEFTILREGVNCEIIQRTQKFKGEPLEIRVPDTIITDESDNLFIDNAINSARISWKSNENVSWVFLPLYEMLMHTMNFDVNEVRKFLLNYLNGKFTQQVSSWSNERIETWISSFIISQEKICGRDYVIGINLQTSQKEIQIVHLGTGRIQHGSRWSNGVHEFIEAREGLIPSNEDYTIASISHPAFFGRYKHIYGLTGTAGEQVERNEVMETYHVDTFDVPPNRKCLRKRLPTEILSNKNELENRLIEIVIETQELQRPLLLLFLSIDDSIQFSKKLSGMQIPHMILNELQREDEDYIVFRAGQPGVVTIATNTAGRGTDIVLSPASKANGGLRVAFTFFPENFRVECQGLGRAGRQGQPGTSEIITSLEDPYIVKILEDINPSAPRDESFIKNLYQKRSEEIKSLSQIRMVHCAQEIKLFNALSVFFSKFKQIKNQFTSNPFLQKEFEKIEINSLNIWYFVEAKLQQEWAKVFSYLCQKSKIDQRLIDQHLQNYEKTYLSPFLQANPKDVLRETLQMLQQI